MLILEGGSVKVTSKNGIELIILGMGPSRKECPFDAEVWSVNTGYEQVAQANGHINKIFLSHKQIRKNGHNVFDWDALNALGRAGVDIINIHKFKDLNSRLYPFKRISKKFNCDYFSNTICYMLAYAIDKGYRKIRFYGVDMRETGEYALEKGGIEYWMGYAKGLGIEIINTKFSTLCKTVTYTPYGTKAFEPHKFVDGQRIIIGLDGTAYARKN